MMYGDDAEKKCPGIKLARIPEKRGKGDLTRYREASSDVMRVLSRFCKCLERASIDEAFLDITEEVASRIERMGFTSEITVSLLPATHLASLPEPANGCEQGGIAVDPGEGGGGGGEGGGGGGGRIDDVRLSHDLTSDAVDTHQRISCEGETDNKNHYQGTLDRTSERRDPHTLAEEEEEEFEVNGPNDDSALFSDSSHDSRHRLLSDWLEREGKDDEFPLAVGAMIASEVRKAVQEEVGFSCSAGISHNKVNL